MLVWPQNPGGQHHAQNQESIFSECFIGIFILKHGSIGCVTRVPSIYTIKGFRKGFRLTPPQNYFVLIMGFDVAASQRVSGLSVVGRHLVSSHEGCQEQEH